MVGSLTPFNKIHRLTMLEFRNNNLNPFISNHLLLRLLKLRKLRAKKKNKNYLFCFTHSFGFFSRKYSFSLFLPHLKVPY